MPDQTEDQVIAQLDAALAGAEAEETTPVAAAETDDAGDGDAKSGADQPDAEATGDDQKETPPTDSWKEEWRKTYNPHVLPEELREWVLNHQRGLSKVTERYEAARRHFEERAEAMASGGGKTKPAADDGPPILGDDIDPQYVESLDSRVAWQIKKTLESLGIAEKLKTIDEVKETSQREKWADSVQENMRQRHGMTTELEQVVMQMYAANPKMEVMLHDDQGQADLIELARVRLAASGRKNKEAENLRHRASAGKQATMRPSAGVRRAAHVDKQELNDEEIAQQLAEEYGIPLT